MTCKIRCCLDTEGPLKARGRNGQKNWSINLSKYLLREGFYLRTLMSVFRSHTICGSAGMCGII